jgi:VanZ family protein
MENKGKMQIKYPFTLCIIVAIFVLCLIPIPDNPLQDISMIDKWTHFVMYGGLCTVAWVEYGLRSRGMSRKLCAWWFFMAPLLMGAFIEVLQATCTGGQRSGEVLDWVADSIGVVIGQLIGIPLARVASKWNKER